MILEANEICKYKDCPYTYVGGIKCHGKQSSRKGGFRCDFMDGENFSVPDYMSKNRKKCDSYHKGV